MQRILVTGCAGFIYSHVCEYLLQDPEIEVVGVDNLTTGSDINNILHLKNHPRFSFHVADVSSPDHMNEMVDLKRYNGLIHGAALTHVDDSIESPLKFEMNNAQGTMNILNVFRKRCQNARILIVSTDEVYGAFPTQYNGYASEETPLKPNSPYASSKAAADLYAQSFFKTYGMNITITRCSNNYGPRQKQKLIPTICSRVLDGQKVFVYGRGMERRDWLYVKDHCEAVKLVYDKGTPGLAYNIATGKHRENSEIAAMVIKELGKDPKEYIEYIPDPRPGHDFAYYISTSRIEELGWKAKTSLPEGIKETVAWYKKTKTN